MVSIFKDIIHGTSSVFTCIVYFITIYYLCISFFGILRKKNERAVEPKKNFALIVAAHNEEIVIGDIVESLKSLIILKNFMTFLLLLIIVQIKLPRRQEKKMLLCMKERIRKKEEKDML